MALCARFPKYSYFYLAWIYFIKSLKPSNEQGHVKFNNNLKYSGIAHGLLRSKKV